MATQTRRESARKSGIGWLWDWAIDHWPSLVTAASGAVMTTLAAFSGWLSVYGPVAWGAIGLLSMLVAALGYFVYAAAAERSANAAYTRSLSIVQRSVNPLQSVFDTERFAVADFARLIGTPYDGKMFRACEIHGPGALGLGTDCQVNRATFFQCDLVAVPRTPVYVYTAVPFVRSTFEGCTFVRVTIFMPVSVAKAFVEDSRRDGRSVPHIFGFVEDEPPAAGL
jgi:hypothetical protein